MYIRKLDPHDEWVNGAYDEEGMQVTCSYCDGDLKFDPSAGHWYCTECGTTMGRREYFNYIGANPPGPHCMNICSTNYPFCKKYCTTYEIDPDDPLLD